VDVQEFQAAVAPSYLLTGDPLADFSASQLGTGRTPLLTFGGEASSVTIKDSRLVNVTTGTGHRVCSTYNPEGPVQDSSTAYVNTLMMFNTSGSGEVTGLVSINCSVSIGSLLHYTGSSNGRLSITNSSFDRTTTAVSVYNGSLVIADSNFTRVSSTSIAAATFDGSFVSLHKCNFSNGGQAYLSSPNVNVTQSVFSHNIVQADGQADGGALFLYSQDLSSSLDRYFDGMYMIADSFFMNNTSTTDVEDDGGWHLAEVSPCEVVKGMPTIHWLSRTANFMVTLLFLGEALALGGLLSF